MGTWFLWMGKTDKIREKPSELGKDHHNPCIAPGQNQTWAMSMGDEYSCHFAIPAPCFTGNLGTCSWTQHLHYPKITECLFSNKIADCIFCITMFSCGRSCAFVMDLFFPIVNEFNYNWLKLNDCFLFASQRMFVTRVPVEILLNQSTQLYQLLWVVCWLP